MDTINTIIPEEFLNVICDKLLLSGKKEIINASQLSDGKSGAYVYRIKVSSKKHNGWYIVKCVNKNGVYYDESTDEKTRAQDVFFNNNNFGNRLVKLSTSGYSGDWVILLYEHALWSTNTISIDKMDNNRLPQYLNVLSRELLELWNGMDTNTKVNSAQNFFEDLLGYRMGENGTFKQKFDELKIDGEKQYLVLGESVYPNPVYYLIGHPESWMSKIGTYVFYKGNSHCDLHGKNILCNNNSKTVEYAIIDFDSYRTDCYLLFDHAYLELSFYVNEGKELESKTWIEQVEPYVVGSPYETTEEKNNLRFQMIRNGICSGITDWINKYKQIRDDIEIQFRMARIAAGVNYFSKKAIIDKPTLEKLIHYIGINLKSFFKSIGFDWQQTLSNETDETTRIGGIIDNKPEELSNKTVDELQQALKEPKSYQNALDSVYGLLITDISGVLFDYAESGREVFSDEIVETFTKLAKQHVSICFTTGRGRTGARQLLLQLAQKIIAKDDNVSWADLARDWVCLTHNGAFLLTTSENNQSGFLANDEELFEDIQRRMRYVRDSLRTINDDYSKIILRETKAFYKALGEEAPQIKGSATIEPVSFRFLLEDCPYEELRNKIFSKAVEEICQNYSSIKNYVWHQTIGKYENKVVFEYSMVCKSDAVNVYICKHKPIDSKNILRIANSGQRGGSDYSFLADGISFSVGEISSELTSKGTCFPVYDKNGTRLLGVEATVYLLNHIHFYPALCFKNVYDIDVYKSRFANSLKGIQKRKREVMDFYNGAISWTEFLYESDYTADRISKVFDTKSGAVSFSDFEWNRIENIIAGSKGDLSFVEKQVRAFELLIDKKISPVKAKDEKPNMAYFMHTDTRVLFRGCLYYYFLYQSSICFSSADIIGRAEWSHVFNSWLGLTKQFLTDFKKTLGVLSSLQGETSQPMCYLARKLVLGGLDNVRNIILLLEEFCFRKQIAAQHEENRDTIIGIREGNEDSLSKLSAILADSVSYMYDALFSHHLYVSFAEKITSNIILELIKLVTEVGKGSAAFVEDETVLSTFVSESFPRWREADCLIENMATIDLFLSSVPDNHKPLAFWGIPYGSLEHPIIAKVLCKKRGIKTADYTNYVFLHGKYEDRHKEEYDLQFIEKNPSDPQAVNILIDDTITSGKTLDICVKLLSLSDAYVDSIIVVRYAGINRLNHYLTHTVPHEGEDVLTLQAAAPDVSRFNNLIHGLLSEAPYTKLFRYGINPEKPYENIRGVFDKAKQRIKVYLDINYDKMSREDG